MINTDIHWANNIREGSEYIKKRVFRITWRYEVKFVVCSFIIGLCLGIFAVGLYINGHHQWSSYTAGASIGAFILTISVWFVNWASGDFL